MEILKNLNEKLCIYDDSETYSLGVDDVLNDQDRYRGATDEEIEELEKYAGFKLPEDYIQFLKEAMNVAITGKKNHFPIIAFLDVYNMLQYREWYPFLEEYKDTKLIIGDDIGDYFLMYYYGEEGFGLYYGDAGADQHIYICASLTELLVEGKGLDKCFDGIE